MILTLDQFVSLSAVLTGYPASTLKPVNDTQLISELLYKQLNLASNKVPVDQLTRLTNVWNSISKFKSPDLEAAVQKLIMDEPAISRLAQNIIYLWYLGIWYDLAKSPSSFASPNIDHVVDPLTYKNGLVWGEMGAHPMGYSTGHFGYWNDVPQLNPIDAPTAANPKK